MNVEVKKEIELLFSKTEELVKRKIYNALMNDYLGEKVTEELKIRMLRDVADYTRLLPTPTTNIYNFFVYLINDNKF